MSNTVSKKWVWFHQNRVILIRSHPGRGLCPVFPGRTGPQRDRRTSMLSTSAMGLISSYATKSYKVTRKWHEIRKSKCSRQALSLVTGVMPGTQQALTATFGWIKWIQKCCNSLGHQTTAPSNSNVPFYVLHRSDYQNVKMVWWLRERTGIIQKNLVKWRIYVLYEASNPTSLNKTLKGYWDKWQVQGHLTVHGREIAKQTVGDGMLTMSQVCTQQCDWTLNIMVDTKKKCILQ